MGLPTPIVILAWLAMLPLIALRVIFLKLPVLRDIVNWLYRPHISADEVRDPALWRAAALEAEKKLDALVGVPLEHAYFESEPGVFLHYVVCGPKDAPAMIFLHGFPEFWFTWLHLLKDFSKTHRCYAPDLRGYNISSKPQGLSDYTTKKLVDDVERFAQFVLGNGKCVLVAHDWGANIAWLAMHSCSFASKFVVLDMPHPRCFRRALQVSTSQKRRSMYILFFQFPYFADDLLSDPAKGQVGKLITSLSAPVRDAFNRAAQQPGAMTAALNYYRCAFGMEQRASVRKQVEVPTLLLMGANTTPFDLKTVLEGTEKYCPNITIQQVPDASHWVQHDQPQKVIELMRQFLAR